MIYLAIFAVAALAAVVLHGLFADWPCDGLDAYLDEYGREEEAG